MLTCRELIEFLDQFVAGELSQSSAGVFHDHLRVCPDCQAYLDSYRKTIALSKLAAAPDEPPPNDVPQALLRAVREAICN